MVWFRKLAMFTLLLEGSALAVTGAEILETIDALSDSYEDQTIAYDAVTTEGNREPRPMSFSVTLQGERRLVEFSAPGDVRGTRVLVLSRNQMYIYLPAYNRVRRVASHTTGQGFMGTTFSDEDMSTSLYAPHYTSTILSESDEYWRLELRPRPETETPYGSLLFQVSKANHWIQEIQFFDEAGERLKTETRSDYRCVEEVCSPARIEMIDHSRNDATSVLNMVEFSANDNVDPSVFSVRNLQRGD